MTERGACIMHYTAEQQLRICHLQELMIEILALQQYQGDLRMGWMGHESDSCRHLQLETMIVRLQARRAREYMALREEVPEIDTLLSCEQKYDA